MNERHVVGDTQSRARAYEMIRQMRNIATMKALIEQGLIQRDEVPQHLRHHFNES